MRAAALYFVAVLATVLLVGMIAWYLTGPPDRRVILVSAGLALVVQMSAFGITRPLIRTNMMLGWGVGSLLRFVSLVLYAVFVARLWRPAIAPALLSFVGFVFVSTVVEPVFLKR